VARWRLDRQIDRCGQVSGRWHGGFINLPSNAVYLVPMDQPSSNPSPLV
jgi:hypothetical protein